MKTNRNKKSMLGRAVAVGAAAAVLVRLRNRQSPEEPQPELSAQALLTPQMQAELVKQAMLWTPEKGIALVLSDDRGELSRHMAKRCRMLFSADGSGLAAVPRICWPENIIRADADPQRLWLAENSLDLAVLVNVLQRWREPQRVLQELRRVLRPDGILLLPTTVRPEAFGDSAWRATLTQTGIPAQQSWSRTELRAVLIAAGWEIRAEEVLEGSFPMVLYVCGPEVSNSSTESGTH